MAKKEKSRGARGGILDLFLLFLLLLSLCSVAVRYLQTWDTGEEQPLSGYRLICVAEGLDPLTAQCVEAGDIFYLPSGDRFGSLYAKRFLPAELCLLSGGEYVEGKSDPALLGDLHLEIEFFGCEGEQGILWQGRVGVLTGQTLLLKSDKATLRIRVLAVTKSGG
jgi:hypothetical protein